MPIFDYLCVNCGKTSEILVTTTKDNLTCSDCGSNNLKKLLSPHSSMSGSPKQSIPGPGDTACCGSSPGQGACAGPGSCCGKNPF